MVRYTCLLYTSREAKTAVSDFLHEVNHKLMGDFVSMSNEEIWRFQKMEKLLENKISRRFKVDVYKRQLHIRVEITLGKYQEQLLNLEKKLESGLYCELTDKELKDSYVEYTLLYDTIANRISIEDVQAKDGRLRLMENVWWEYDKLPHMLIAGGTGGGKTYFILTLRCV